MAGVDGGPHEAVCLGLTLGGVGLSGLVLVVWQGPAFLGLAVPFGMVAGLLAYLVASALRLAATAGGARPTKEGGRAAAVAEPWRVMALVTLLSAIVAHFIESSFGIATVSTHAHFWVFAALMLTVGRGAADAYRTRNDEPSLASPAESARLGSAHLAARGREALVSAGMVTVILVTLGYNYTAAGLPDGHGVAGLADAGAGGPIGFPSLAALALFLVTWIVGGILAYTDEPHETQPRAWVPRLIGMGTSLALGGACWGLARWNVVATTRATPIDLTSVVGSAERLAQLISIYAVVLLMLVLALALVLPIDPRRLGNVGSRRIHPPGGARSVVLLAGYGIPPIAAVWLALVLNLQTVHADMVYNVGRQFDDQNQPLLALPFYDKAVELAPTEDHYRLVIGRGCLNAVSGLADSTQREALLVRGESAFRAGQARQPLNTDHTAGLARLYRTWAAVTDDSLRRLERTALASAYYQRATTLSPTLPALWNEWAALSFQLLGNSDAAQSRIDRSRALDPELEQTRQLQRDLDVWRDTHSRPR